MACISKLNTCKAEVGGSWVWGHCGLCFEGKGGSPIASDLINCTYIGSLYKYPQIRTGSESLQTGKHKEMLRGDMPSEATDSHTQLMPCPVYLFLQLLLNYILLHERNYGWRAFLNSVEHSSKWSNLHRGLWKPLIYSQVMQRLWAHTVAPPLMTGAEESLGLSSVLMESVLTPGSWTAVRKPGDWLL